MSNTYRIYVRNCFLFEGSEYQFKSQIKEFLKYNGYQFGNSDEEKCMEKYC